MTLGHTQLLTRLPAWSKVLALVLFASSTSAHQSSTYDQTSIVSPIGQSNIWLKNLYEDRTTYAVEVLDRDMKPTEAKWSSSLVNNSVSLDPQQLVDIGVTVNEKGKYYVCTKVQRDKKLGVVQLSSRVCLRLWYR